jgi:hypothetical protein
MKLRVIDLDGSITAQATLLERSRWQIMPSQRWGPFVRLACGFGTFRRFEADLKASLDNDKELQQPTITLYGSGDFHHVSLALIRRLQTPINLLVLDNHPDWMRGVPFLHCGTWLYHAAHLPRVERIFHVGGDVDFDNYYRPLAPWPLLQSGKLSVVPGVRRFVRGRWARVPNDPVRSLDSDGQSLVRIAEIARSFETELAKRPLYVSLDKDVMTPGDATVNWDSGHLTLAEVQMLLESFIKAARGNLAGMDITGDWSQVKLRGILRQSMHLTMHPELSVDPAEATRRNEATNLKLLETVEGALRDTASALLSTVC